MTGKTSRVSFQNSRGDTIAALLDMPAETPVAFGIFAPCFTCVKESHAAFKISRALQEKGVATLRIDVSGTGESGGTFEDSTFSTRIDDILSAAKFLADSFSAPAFLLGHSISGTAALASAKHLPHTKVIATLGSPADTRAVIDKFRANGDLKEEGGVFEINVLGRIYKIKPAFIDDMLAHDVATDAAGIADKKLIVFHAPNDRIVDLRHAREIVARARCEKELVLLPETSTHLLEKNAPEAEDIAARIFRAISE